MRRLARLALLSAVFTLGACATAPSAGQPSSPPPAPSPQASGIKRNLLQRTDVPQTSAHECVMGTAEIAPGVNIGRHTHFGVEMGYVLDGEADLMVDGEPVKHLKAGDSYQIGAGKVHDARNTGTGPAKVLAVYSVEKGKPLATPAP